MKPTRKEIKLLQSFTKVNGWVLKDGKPHYEGETKRLDDTDQRLNKTVREGRVTGKSITNIRSFMKNGRWNYKYLK